ncbi:hypothetical protein T484DRAFT_1801412 [Baffinella frigidus]|nr:hypothetical protein T484DRAFT_1801412 [Cryptophyta sp. CCMP2293]
MDDLEEEEEGGAQQGDDGSVRVTHTAHVRARVVVSGGAAAAAEGINKDGVAVLVSLDGWRADNLNGVLAHRPCPVQHSTTRQEDHSSLAPFRSLDPCCL